MNRLVPLALGLIGASMPAWADPLPGATLDAATMAQLEATPPVSPPRTRYVDAAGAPIYTNRLIHERSPYLRQHAHNPVNWRPWGAEALAEARARDVPVFLSVGYATCHWCHVMEEESFDNAEIAALVNANYVPVKVDRETLPDIDAQYMLATQILTGGGGWPNNLFLMPDGEPIVSIAYQQPQTFAETLTGLAGDWRNPEGRTAMTEQAASVAEYVRLIAGSRSAAEEVTDDVFEIAVAGLLADHDNFQGGFGDGPKFPTETTIRYLLDRYERTGDRQAAEAALLTLRNIAAGGIHDHVGGGFHRYAVDQNWRTPHFEKMLYNQALLTGNFLQAYRLTGDPVFERAARRALDYVIRDMTAPEGAFFAAQDADSKGPDGEVEEGAYYTWTFDQLDAALGSEAASVRSTLGLDQRATVPSGAVAHVSPDDRSSLAYLDPALERMRQARGTRPAPLTDTKIIAGWNGLMIRALVDGAKTLNEPRYLAAAQRAAAFITGRMLSANGDLARAWASGPLEAGALRDYAWMGLGLIALSDATGDNQWLSLAQRMSDEINRRFSDGPTAPLRLAQSTGPLGPTYDVIEGATPTGNASTLELYAMLSRRGEDSKAVDNIERADRLLGALSAAIVAAPENNISSVTAAAMYRKGETGSTRLLGGGVATAEMALSGDRLTVTLDFAPGWHANSHRPLNPDLIATEIAGLGLGQVAYPSPKMVSLGFQDEPLAVLEDRAQISAVIGPETESAELTIQICGTDRCLPPEQHVFRLPRAL